MDERDIRCALDRARVDGGRVTGRLDGARFRDPPSRANRKACADLSGRRGTAEIQIRVQGHVFDDDGRLGAAQSHGGRSWRTARTTGDPRASDYLLSIFKEFRPRRVRLPIFSDKNLRRLTMPVLLIAGGRDAMLDSKGTLKRLTRCVPKLVAHYLPETGHLIVGQTATISKFLLGNA